MTDYVKQITFTIAPSGAWVPPYTLPSAGQAIAVGTNNANDIRPPGVDTTSWGYGLFNSYGCGTMVPDYSQGGAYVIASSGGHTAPDPNIDAAIFDFQDATWKRRANANGIAARSAGYVRSETTWDDYMEITVGNPSPPQIPAPAHLYAASSWHRSTALGGGSQGNFLRVGGFYAANDTPGPRTSLAVHQMDLSTGLWSRVTNVLFASMPGGVAVGCHDTILNRWYFGSSAQFHQQTTLQYLDSTDWTIKSVSVGFLVDTTGSGGWPSLTFDPVRRLILFLKDGWGIYALDTLDFGAGWRQLSTSGTFGSVCENRFIYYPPDGCFYSRGNTTGNVLSKLQPPAASPFTNTWVRSTVSVGGASMPNYTTTGSNDGRAHNSAFCYVPSIQCLAWVPGEASSVYLVKP